MDASTKGGEARSPKAAPLMDDPAVAGLDLESAAGVKGLLAATMRNLAKLPFDVRTATAIIQAATAQKAVIEVSDIEDRLAAVEAAQSPGLRRA